MTKIEADKKAIEILKEWSEEEAEALKRANIEYCGLDGCSDITKPISLKYRAKLKELASHIE